MATFHYVVKNDYDHKVVLGKESVLCYSEKRFKELFPDVDLASLAQARLYSQKEKKPRGRNGTSIYEEQTIGDMAVGGRTLGVAPAGTNGKLVCPQVGYVSTADGSYVALCKSRLAFLLSLAGVSLAILLALLLLFWMLGQSRPTVDPDNPLPPLDPTIVPEGDGGRPQVPGSNGGGSVSMVYTLKASLSLATKEFKIHFKNPPESNHSVALDLYIISEGREYLVAQSGLVPSGNALYQMKLSPNAPKLMEGQYEGFYRVRYYHPETGVRAIVRSDISDVIVAVQP